MHTFVPHLIRVRIAGARQVSILGDFNNWHSNAHPLVEVSDGLWQRIVDLPVGEHRYAFFVIDGDGAPHESVRSRIIAEPDISWAQEPADHVLNIVALPALNHTVQRRVA